jgi:hypothetical protein
MLSLGVTQAQGRRPGVTADLGAKRSGIGTTSEEKILTTTTMGIKNDMILRFDFPQFSIFCFLKNFNTLLEKTFFPSFYTKK